MSGIVENRHAFVEMREIKERRKKETEKEDPKILHLSKSQHDKTNSVFKIRGSFSEPEVCLLLTFGI